MLGKIKDEKTTDREILFVKRVESLISSENKIWFTVYGWDEEQ